LFSFAILRTSGEERTRSPTAAVEGGAAAVGAAAGAAATGAGVAAAAGAAAFPAAPPMTATTVLIVTVEPSGTLISERTPATGEAAEEGDADAAAASSMVATIVLILTVVPSAILISVKVPAAGEGISASTLSVEISKSGSSRWIVSPGFFSHFVIVPSVMDSPIWGMITSVGMNFSPSNCGCGRPKPADFSWMHLETYLLDYT